MNTKKVVSNSIRLALLIIVIICYPVFAQTPESQQYRLDIDKNFGSGLGSDISGVFTLSVVGTDDITSVSYHIDGESMAEVTVAPFEYQFNTEQYAFGSHALTATIKNSAGDSFTTVARNMNFMSPEDEASVLNQKIIPFILILVGIVVVSRLVIFGSKRKQTPINIDYGAHRDYGVAGGSICKKCGRPTPRHLWGLNILIGKLDRCENCGTWSVMQAEPIEVLRAAEKLEENLRQEKKNGDDLRELIDNSKYQ
jgi:hypothetical protein